MILAACISRAALEREQAIWSVGLCLWFSDYVEVFALAGWREGCGSLPAWIRSARGVSLLWGLCEALWVGLLVSGCMFPIGCFCLSKTQRDSRLLKDAVSIFCALLEKKSSISCWLQHIPIDGTLLFRRDHLVLMGPFCVINIWMESECQCAILSSRAEGLYTPVLTQTSFVSMLFVE